MFHIFTDGGRRDSSKSTGVSSWAMVVYGSDKMHLGTKSKGFSSDLALTNNQTELMAVIAAYEFLDKAAAEGVIYTDSAYVCNGINSWIHGWKNNGWKTKQGKQVMNLELWQEIDKLMSLSVRVQKVAAHKENTSFEGRGNFEADALCGVAMDEAELDEHF